MTDMPPSDDRFANAIADPFVEVAAPDAASPTVSIDATIAGVVTITINRPEKKNAFDEETIAALREAFETLHGADHVRVAFIRGAGGTFSAGADLDWMRRAAEWTEAENRDDAMNLARMLKALYDIPCLTVALVEGAAMGGGAGLVAACDMAIAVQGARFAFSEVKLGLIPATISPYVVEAIGARQAKGLFCTGRLFDADQARDFGLVQEVVADAAALEAARQRIKRDALTAAPEAVAASKRLVRDVEHHRIDDGLMHETAKRIAKARVSDEGREGVRAFLEKRKPSWID
jgi:methylglutaconyl-CoA hydratase